MANRQDRLIEQSVQGIDRDILSRIRELRALEAKISADIRKLETDLGLVEASAATLPIGPFEIDYDKRDNQNMSAINEFSDLFGIVPQNNEATYPYNLHQVIKAILLLTRSLLDFDFDLAQDYELGNWWDGNWGQGANLLTVNGFKVDTTSNPVTITLGLGSESYSTGQKMISVINMTGGPNALTVEPAPGLIMAGGNKVSTTQYEGWVFLLRGDVWFPM